MKLLDLEIVARSVFKCQTLSKIFLMIFWFLVFFPKILVYHSMSHRCPWGQHVVPSRGYSPTTWLLTLPFLPVTNRSRPVKITAWSQCRGSESWGGFSVCCHLQKSLRNRSISLDLDNPSGSVCRISSLFSMKLIWRPSEGSWYNKSTYINDRKILDMYFFKFFFVLFSWFFVALDRKFYDSRYEY